jgi:MFS family permease
MSAKPRLFNPNLVLLIVCQGLFFTNNVTFIGINGLVGMNLSTVPWMATLPIMGYVIGGALSTALVARTQSRHGRKKSFQLGLVVAVLSSLLCAFAVWIESFWLLVLATLIAGYYSANGQLYRFAATEVVDAGLREKAIVGPALAQHTKDVAAYPFMGAYLALAVLGVLGMAVMHFIRFPDDARTEAPKSSGRDLKEIARQPVFIVAALGAGIGYGIMNLLMAATPLAMEVDGFPFSDTATVLQWHVIGMFAPGFITGSLIKRYGTLQIMLAGLVLNMACIFIALSGNTYEHYLISLFLLGVGWNFLFTGSTNLATQAHTPQERDKAQGAINFVVFFVMAVSSFSSGALVTTQGWWWLNIGSLVPAVIVGVALLVLYFRRARSSAA